MEIHRIAELKPKQLAVMSVASLTFVALPGLTIFFRDIELFEKLELSKLLLLCFCSGCPLVMLFFSLAWLSAEKMDDSYFVPAFLLGCAIGGLLLISCLFCFGPPLMGPKSGWMTKGQQALAIPLALGIFSFYVIDIVLWFRLWRARRKKK